MKEFWLYTINGMIDLNYKTASLEDMKKKVRFIQDNLLQNRIGREFWEGAYISIYENNRLVDSIDYYEILKVVE